MSGEYLKYLRRNRRKIAFYIVILTFLIALEIFVLNAIIQSNSSLKPSNTTSLESSNVSSNETFYIAIGRSKNITYAPSNKTVYVAGDGSGNFTCDGSDDQVEINQALAYVAENPQFSTVHLKGPNTYVISDSILIGSNTVLEGDPTAVIKLEDKAGWPV